MSLFSKYAYAPDKDQVDRGLDLIIANVENVISSSMLKDCFSYMDLTTLSASDTVESVTKLVEKTNALQAAYPDYPLPASICVYPNFAPVVNSVRASKELKITTVASAFPHSQSFLEVKILEAKQAVLSGADEIDIVLALNSFLVEDYASATEEIRAIRKAIDEAADSLGKKICLKVILETGLLLTVERIAEASFLAMEAGADFIKTSTGKVEVNATLVAAYVMCTCIKKFYEATGKKVGFKAAGGVSTAVEAATYYSIVSTILGKEWLTKDLFRLGVSRLANNLMSYIEQKTISHF